MSATEHSMKAQIEALRKKSLEEIEQAKINETQRSIIAHQINERTITSTIRTICEILAKCPPVVQEDGSNRYELHFTTISGLRAYERPPENCKMWLCVNTLYPQSSICCSIKDSNFVYYLNCFASWGHETIKISSKLLIDQLNARCNRQGFEFSMIEPKPTLLKKIFTDVSPPTLIVIERPRKTLTHTLTARNPNPRMLNYLGAQNSSAANTQPSAQTIPTLFSIPDSHMPSTIQRYRG